MAGNWGAILAAIPRGQLAQSTLLSLFWQGIRVALLALWVIWLARLLGSQGYGAFSGAAGIGTALGGLAGLGLGLVMYKTAIRMPHLFENLWMKAITVTALSGLAGFALFMGICIWLFSNTLSLKALAAIGLSELFFYPIVTTSAFAFAARRRIGWSAALPSIPGALRLVALALFSFLETHKDLNEYVWYHLFATAIGSGITVLFVYLKLTPGQAKFNVRKADLIEGIGFCATWTSSNALSSIDKSLALRFGGADMAGLYSAAYRIASIFTQPIDAVINAAMPRLFSTDKTKETSALIRYLVCILLGYGVIAGSIFWLLHTMLFSLLGPSFEHAADAMKWFALFIPVYGMRLLATNILMSIDRVKTKIAIEVLGLILLGVCGYTLIPLYGLMGAIYMVIVTETILAAVSWLVLITLTYISRDKSR